MIHFDSVVSRFDQQASRWRDLYEDQEDIFSVIHRARRNWAVQTVAALDLGPATIVLDAGVGAGGLAAALAESGLRVVGVDASARMLDLANQTASARGVGERVATARVDASALPFDDRSFSTVAALGLLPWVSDAGAVVQELARVTAPGGYVVVNADNAVRLSHLMDPRENPRLARVRITVATWLGRNRTPGVLPHGQRATELRQLVEASGLELVYLRPLGFGPFTFNRDHTLPHRAGRALNLVLQWLADRGLLGLASVSNMHLVLARRPDCVAASDPRDAPGRRGTAVLA